MARGRSFLILVIVGLAIGAWVYFFEAKRDPGAASDRATLFAVEPGAIEEIEIRASSGDVTRLQKSGADWRIVTPVTADADAVEVGTLTSTLESLEIQRTVDENPASVAEYGLDPARFSVAFRAAGETAMRRLDVGDKTPTGGDLYVRVEGRPALVLVSSYVETSLDRSTFSLRDKNVLKLPQGGVTGVRLEAPGAPAVGLAREGARWRLTAPLNAKADFSAADGIVSRIFQARMSALVHEGDTPPAPADLKKYGLDRPQVLASFQAGSARADLAIGGKHEDGTLYARDLARPLVFTVEASLLDDLRRKPEDLRAKDVFEFRSYTALGIDLTLGGATWTFAKEKPAGDDPMAPETWKLVKPEPRDVDQTAVTDLLTTLSNLRAESFADRAHASGETLVVVARSGDAASPAEERVTLRKSGGTVHAIRDGEPGAAVVPAAEFDKALEYLKTLAAK